MPTAHVSVFPEPPAEAKTSYRSARLNDLPASTRTPAKPSGKAATRSARRNSSGSDSAPRYKRLISEIVT